MSSSIKGFFIPSFSEGMETGHTTMTLQQEEELRAIYIKLFSNKNSDAIKELTNIAKEEIKNVEKELEKFIVDDSKDPLPLLTISYQKKFKEINLKEEKEDVIVLTIGKKTGVSFQLDIYDTAASRLHLILFIFKKYRKMCIVDVGSMNGIKMLKRSHTVDKEKKELISSIPYKREIIYIDFDETTIFEIGNHQIGFNIKNCLICYEKSRSMTFLCGKNSDGKQISHFVCCDECGQKLDKCPICRYPVETPPLIGDFLTVTCVM